MIIQALADYYDTLSKAGELEKTGWSKLKVSYALSVDDGGRLLDIIDLRQSMERGAKTVLVPQTMYVPTQPSKTSGLCATFLCSNCKYFLGIDESETDSEAKGKKNRDRAVQAFNKAAELHISLLGKGENPESKAICEYFGNWKPELARKNPKVAELAVELSKGGNIVFWYKDHYVLSNVSEVRDVWDAYYSKPVNPIYMPCLDTGTVAEIENLHPNIKGVKGAQTSGAKIVSFNVNALESYGHEHGEIAPTSKRTAFAYGEALNNLLSDSNHVNLIGDTTVVSWAADGVTAYEDAFDAMLFGSSETISSSDLAAVISNLAEGKAVNWGKIPLHPENEFYILGLSPNAARLSVRFFLKDTFGDIAEKVSRHYNRLEIAYMKPKYPSVYSLLLETVNQKATDKTPSPQLAGEMIRSVLSDSYYPSTLFTGVEMRIRAEHTLNGRRASIIKAYLLKNTNNENYKEALKVELNESCTYVPYLLGRIFEVLEEIQSAANPNINATIKDKYFTSASATPDYVFPTLINLGMKHLKKIDGESHGKYVYLNRKLSGLLGMIHEEYPKKLSLHDQGIFQLGYYHQSEAKYVKKEEEN